MTHLISGNKCQKPDTEPKEVREGAKKKKESRGDHVSIMSSMACTQ